MSKHETEPHVKDVALIPLDQAEKHGMHQYEGGVLLGSIVAAGATSGKPLTFKNFAMDTAVGALIGVAAIAVGRAFDYILKRGPNHVKGDVLHATVIENPPEGHSR